MRLLFECWLLTVLFSDVLNDVVCCWLMFRLLRSALCLFMLILFSCLLLMVGVRILIDAFTLSILMFLDPSCVVLIVGCDVRCVLLFVVIVLMILNFDFGFWILYLDF